jgi:Bacteriophage tail sheath protein
MNPKTPGVYIEEISGFPPSVAQVETAIPAFIGYTQRAEQKGQNVAGTPTRIDSLLDYESTFGGPARPGSIKVTLDQGNRPIDVAVDHQYLLYHSLRMFFENGGTDAYICSVGAYAADGAKDKDALADGLDAVGRLDEPTLLVFPDAALMGASDLGDLQRKALDQCADLGDRFVIMDLEERTDHAAGVAAFRQNIGTDHLKYGAAYTPHLVINIPLNFNYCEVTLLDKSGLEVDLKEISQAARLETSTIDALAKAIAKNAEPEIIGRFELELRMVNRIYGVVASAIEQSGLKLPPSGAVAGVFALVDNSRGVWKAPANVSLSGVVGLTEAITQQVQEGLNVDPVAGKSINAIRSFPGIGNLIWGARTLAGNDNEWRYVPVRRFFNMVEESVKKSSAWAVFEPNDATLWSKLKGMIENYLTLKWREGALAGAKPEDSFFVNVGLGETMTQLDIDEGRLMVEIGMAPIRPAEFIILRFAHKMADS